jgi:predicted phage terminase large subunit-like protein
MSEQLLEVLYSERHRRYHEEQAAHLSGSLKDFVREAWSVLKPAEPYHHNWHVEAICEHLEAVSTGQILRLQIWVPRATMKSLNVSIFWPAWEWTNAPWLRFWTASYELGLAGRLAGKSRDLMVSDWYRVRWGDKFELMKEGERYYSNDKGGTRLATAPGSTALGEHGHRIIIDDAINAAAADATSRVVLEATNEWYDATVQGSKADPKNAAEVIIMQRLHENDLAQHAYERNPEEWTILCLPERYEANHPFVYPKDPRAEGELLWPSHRDEKASEALARSLTSHRAAGQMQQRPGAREGEILKRHHWRFYDPKLFRDEKLKARRPKFRSVVQSVDTPLKDKESNDLVAIQAWGVAGGDRYLLDLKKGHMNYTQAKRAILEQAVYIRRLFPSAAHHCLIENAGYGVELIQELKREISGVLKITRGPDGDKILRAESAAADLESGNCFLPGYRMGADEFSMPDETRSPADIVDFIDSCALFPNAKNDDDVDAWSQCMNWLRSRPSQPARTWSSFRNRSAG